MGVATMVGSRVKRREDPRLITGHATYTDDMKPLGTHYMHAVRSQYAHARIKSIDISKAKEIPGVMLILTGAEMKANTGQLPWVPAAPVPINAPERYAIVTDKVNFVGDIVAAVIAETRGVARDAAEAIVVEYEQLPAVVNIEDAIKEGAPQIYDNVPNNIGFELDFGNDVADTFAKAEVVVEQRIVNQRLAPNPMETRSVLAEWRIGEDELTLYTSTQIPHILKTLMSGAVGVPEHKLRVVAPEVGGGFGCKLNMYAEELICAYASKKLGKPVKWVETRSESLMATIHGRDQIDYVRIASTKDGKITGLDVKVIADMGAYYQVLTTCIPALTALIVSGSYAIPNVHCKIVHVLTNKTPTDAYRGAGRPEATYLIERMLDLLANELGMDVAELRRKNFIQPNQFPYSTPLGLTYDSGNYEAALDKALQVFGYDEARKTQEEARAAGRYVGIGFSTYVEVCGMGPSGGMFTQRGWEVATVRFELTGKVTVFTGVSPHGQGQETAFAQMVAGEFGIPVEDVVVKHGDTMNTSYGLGTYGSRGLAVGGGAVVLATETVKEKAKKIAAYILEASAEDIELNEGTFSVKGASGGKTCTIQDVAVKAYLDPKMPTEIEPGLEATRFFEPNNFVFPFGTHICMVEVDAETGETKILKYVAVDDCGNQINPLIVEGQVHGGLAQGIAQALYEEVVYDDNGQLISGTLMDYAVPTADELPTFTLDHTTTPTPVNPMGSKGIGEAGTIGSTPAVANAVMDAIKSTGVKDINMPFRPEKLWKAING